MSGFECQECGGPVAEVDRFCSTCGHGVDAVPGPPTAAARSAWLTRSRLGALAVSSAIATGVILGSGLGGPSPAALAAALLSGPAAG
ncbi:MAG: hypothetical protein QOC95_1163, partial [Thermoleophilaceae bacterium]|nr:hypothetical protein [Thermoleophilaceae bacterium]